MVESMKESNHLNCYFLTQNGYNDAVVEVNEVKKAHLMVPYSKERIDMNAKENSFAQPEVLT